MSINVSRRIKLLFMRKLKNSILHAFPPSIFDLGKCPSPVVLLNPLRVSVVPRRNIYADLSFWLQPLLWAASGKETSNMPASFFQLFHEKPGSCVAEDAAGTLWLLLNFFLQAHLGIYCSIE